MVAPRIGVTRSLSPKLPHTTVPFTYQRYHDRVSEAGGLPVDLAPAVVTDYAAALAGLDGLLVTGGPDINPARYGQTVHPLTEGIDAARDELEIGLLRLALDRDLPILAICRGQQALNVALGGGLLQHIASGEHVSDAAGESRWHEVTVAPDALLARLLGATALTVNSRHHQAVTADLLAPGLTATAWSPDGLIEALEGRERRWLHAVQWHPEREEIADQFRPLFAAFIQAATTALAPG